MSKRLNKRQQRLEDEFKQAEEQAEAAIKKPQVQEEELTSTTRSTGGGGAFAALNDGLDDAEEEEEEDEVEVDTPKKKSNKKKKKKKTKAGLPSDLVDSPQDSTSSPASISTPSRHTPGGKGGVKSTPSKDEMGMDELDRALMEIKAKFGDLDQPAASTSSSLNLPVESPSSSSYVLRTLLSVDLKNLDADAELRKFFGSKVVGSAASSSSSSKRGTLLKTHLAKPRGNWPPPNTFLGLGMRELTEGEVKEKRRGMGSKGLKDEGSGTGERWWTFEHGGGWREAERQFLGAVGSHDPNQLFALLQVFPYHTDTILQMGEVYRQQADLSQASEYIDRALFAFERAFAPGFNIAQGNVRLDFDRVENRGFYLALIRNLQFLGRRGCWVTSFTFAKLLLAMDPHTDPQASLLWLDFLSIKSNNSSWLLSLLSTWDASLSDLGWQSASKQGEKERIVLSALPGMGWAKALALRAEEKKEKGSNAKEGEEKKSDEALREAVMTFPWVLPLLADKVGFSIPPEARNHPLLELRLGYEPGPLTPLHLLSHIYVLRSSALWKEAYTLQWLQSRLPHILPDLLSPSNATYPPRQTVLDHFKSGTPEGIVRHVMVAEDNSTLLGFLEPRVREGMGMAFDPLPPRRSVSSYDNNYFMGLTTRRSGGGRNRTTRDGGDDDGAEEERGFLSAWINSLMEWTRPGVEGVEGAGGPGGEDEGVLRALAGRVREVFGGEGTEEERTETMIQIMAMAGIPQGGAAGGGGGRGIPGGFPGQRNYDEEEESDEEGWLD